MMGEITSDVGKVINIWLWFGFVATLAQIYLEWLSQFEADLTHKKGRRLQFIVPHPNYTYYEAIPI